MVNCVGRFDDLRNYQNERSVWLSQLREQIEEPWQAWEQQQMMAASDSQSPGQQQLPQQSNHHGISVMPELMQQYQQMSLDQMKEGLRQRWG